jgi:hypothetical protein
MADVKTIKVEKVEFNREYPVPGKNFTIYYFNLEDSDGGKAQFSSNTKTQVKFLVGETYEVKVETKQNSAGSYFFVDYSDAEKEKRKEGKPGEGKAKWSPYSRSRPESTIIIAQSSYEAAALVSVKVGENSIDTHEKVAVIAKMFANFIVDQSGFNTTDCKNGNKDALKTANEKSIVYQKALKIAVELLDLKLMEKKLGDPIKLRNTQGMIALTELIVEDIFTIANGL